MPISPVIVIPGITASDLHDEYELPPEAVWTTMLKRRYDRVTLHPEDQRYELREPARVMPRGPFPLIYEDLVEELRDGLSEDQPGPVPVFPFGYDWRMPLHWTEERLAAFVREVIDRTLLMKHYRDDEAYRANPTVSLIGHSMGGLIIAGYVESLFAGRIGSPTGGSSLVDKVVTLGTPFRGSYEAILKVATGTSEFGDDSGKARERRMARMTPALYHLLPESAGSIASHGGMAVNSTPSAGRPPPNFFRPEAWQPNVVQTIEHQVRDWDVTGAELFRKMLDEARAHRERISGLELPDAGDGWLAIAGVDSRTRVGLRVARDENGFPRFDLRGAERRNEWDSEIEGDRRDTGDGTVPLEGAIPPFLDDARVVCVTPGDFGYWEIRDRALSAAAGFHGLMPRMNMLHRRIARGLNHGRRSRKSNQGCTICHSCHWTTLGRRGSQKREDRGQLAGLPSVFERRYGRDGDARELAGVAEATPRHWYLACQGEDWHGHAMPSSGEVAPGPASLCRKSIGHLGRRRPWPCAAMRTKSVADRSGERVSRRVETALDTHRGRMLAASDPKRSEAERAQAHTRPRTRTRPSD